VSISLTTSADFHTYRVNVKYDRGLLQLLHSQLHWLDVPEQVMYKLGVIMYGCLRGQVPQYLMDLCLPVSDVSLRQHLWSATRRFLVVP